MSETYQVLILGALIAVVQLLLTAILGWLAWEIRQLRRDVGSRIHFNECEHRMGEHNRRLTKIEGKVGL